MSKVDVIAHNTRMSTLQHQLGIRIKMLRIAHGFSQEEFADRCGFARTYMSRIETGGANPSLNALGILAVALGIELKDLLDFSGMSAERQSLRGRKKSQKIVAEQT